MAVLALLATLVLAGCADDPIAPADSGAVPSFDMGFADSGSVVAGYDHACALDAQGRAWCWGYGEGGTLGVDSVDLCVEADVLCSPVPRRVQGGRSFVQLSAGGDHTCGLTADGRVYCWGVNNFGSLGPDVDGDTAVPVRMSTSLRFTQISSGSASTCGVTASHRIWCWGQGVGGALGNGQFVDSPVPVRVTGSVDWARVVVGRGSACGIALNGALFCWGWGLNGELGNGAFDVSAVPVRVTGPRQWRSVAVSKSSLAVCGVASNGRAYCWGTGGFMLGQAAPYGGTLSTPTAIVSVRRYTDISVGGFHTCAIREDGATDCWGIGTKGQLGDGNGADHVSPAPTIAPTPLVAVSLGVNFSCGHDAAGAVFCWGLNELGQAGRPIGNPVCGGVICVRTPARVPRAYAVPLPD